MEHIGLALSLILIVYLWKRMKDMKEFESYKNYSTTEEFKKTVALGLYQRFCKENEDNPSYSSVYLKSDPLDFEHFVADIMQYRYGENVFVTQGSGDFGVDIEHGNGEGKVLGQVKCKRKDEMYEPIAIIHSNMVKQGASRGYVVNTAGFTENAYAYAQGLNIDLIDGIQLVDMWINYKNPVVETISTEPFQPSDITPVL